MCFYKKNFLSIIMNDIQICISFLKNIVFHFMCWSCDPFEQHTDLCNQSCSSFQPAKQLAVVHPSVQLSVVCGGNLNTGHYVQTFKLGSFILVMLIIMHHLLLPVYTTITDLDCG